MLDALGHKSMPGARSGAGGWGVVRRGEGADLDEGVLEVIEIEAVAAFDPPDPDHAPATLNPDQAAAAESIAEAVGSRGFVSFLLDGVTGSGKTEAYLEAAARALKRRSGGADPDPAARDRPDPGPDRADQRPFRRRARRMAFRRRAAASPSGVGGGAVAGRCNIVVGARSALFLPYANLRLIIVDEEHDGSFKQEEGLIYHGRDLAVARARIEGATVVLASATPSLETLWNAHQGRYRWLKLGARHGAAVLPDIGLLDLRAAPPDPQTWLSQPLREAIGETLRRGRSRPCCS